MSSYNSNGKDLGDLVLALSNLQSRIRIGSLEVNIITREFLDKLSKSNNFVPHFHLSMQSGCDTVLKRMNRHYTASVYLSKVELIREYFPDCNITTDIIVGFSGETDEEFLETVATVKKAKFGYIHIFPYSEKKGTVAQRLYKDMSKSIKKERANRLATIRDVCALNYIVEHINKTYEVIIEDQENDYMVGFTPNYIKVYLPLDKRCFGQIKTVKLLAPYSNGALGEIING